MAYFWLIHLETPDENDHVASFKRSFTITRQCDENERWTSQPIHHMNRLSADLS
jgi:hypothetical protein